MFHVTNFVPVSSMTTLEGFSRSFDLKVAIGVVLNSHSTLKAIEQSIRKIDNCHFILIAWNNTSNKMLIYLILFINLMKLVQSIKKTIYNIK